MPESALAAPDIVAPARRRLLQAALGSAALLALPGCVTRIAAPSAAAARLQLPRLQVDPALVIREVAGLRPFRPTGFRVEPERLGEKLVIHNYGHGGCGVTLSWGTAELALELALAQPQRRAAVLGCGAVGLATARLLQDHGFDVTLYARELPPDTVSNIAGAQWGPSALTDRELRTPEFGARLARASRFAHRRFQLLPDQRYGIRWMPLYFVSKKPGFEPGWEWAQTPELFRTRTHAPGTHPFAGRYLHEIQTMIIEPTIYLPAMIDAVRLAGGRVVVRGFAHLDEVAALPEPLVFNCTGLGARDLFGDASMLPIKGQLTVLAPQPEIDYATIAGRYYMFPRRDGIQLGGTHERNVWSTEPDPALSAQILEGQRKVFDWPA
ncbi:NAD(P)/FAD-dependent oxidoreductase [Luteimonas aquatica]|uniref:NAD(P)/FAD-dependent oxidoreductase n=1 Tax=Luteimonas aquatica TaxID=450364 RepID=UPI001F568FBA|nr:FAD-dependent oxidoreductase [Luteimonas aquatica]